MTSDQEQVPAEPHQTEGTTLFAFALVFSALQWKFGVAGLRLIPAIGPTSPTLSYFLLSELIAEEFLPFLVSPVILFYVFYRLGKGVLLAERYTIVVALLFVGGVVGGGAAYWLLPLALGGTYGGALPNPVSVVITVTNFAYLMVDFGLGPLFPGFVSIALANLRQKSFRAAAWSSVIHLLTVCHAETGPFTVGERWDAASKAGAWGGDSNLGGVRALVPLGIYT